MNTQAKEDKRRDSAYLSTNEQYADMGYRFPVDFLDILAESAHVTIREWLKKHNAPYEVLQIIGKIECLHLAKYSISVGDFSSQEAGDLIDTVSLVTKLIEDFGGTFHGPCLSVVSRLSVASFRNGHRHT